MVIENEVRTKPARSQRPDRFILYYNPTMARSDDGI